MLLLIFSTILDYFTAIQIARSEKRKFRLFWFWLSISVNLGFLGFFKYYNFFANSFSDFLTSVGLHTDMWALQVILPVGISFYTFHGLSYVIDIYKKKIGPEKNFIDYALFVCFFPLLVAGPIERATHLLPQIKSKRVFKRSQAIDGLRQILWGFFKKIVIADGCAVYVASIFGDTSHNLGSTNLLGAVFFAVQIYCDFSGYSDIALGVAKLFGIDLLRNFAFPYFSRDIAEFWRRWHISLSSWFKDYLYIPLGGSKVGTAKKIRNVFLIFIVSGFWHGANWTFIFWGMLNALFILPSIFFERNRKNIEIAGQGKIFPSVREFASILITFAMTVFAWIFFRSASMSGAFNFISRIFSRSLFAEPAVVVQKYFLLYIFGFFLVEWLGRTEQFAISNLNRKMPLIARWGLYISLIEIIIASSPISGVPQQFIYFQF
jgi:D-alanyl-lipoteichoic acid acyltransferase DltB (MBOAT superfamily)